MSTGSRAEVQLESDRLRVVKWTIEPGGVIPMHRHDYEYVVVPMVNGVMHAVNVDGTEVAVNLVAGESYSREAGAEHQVENRSSDQVIVFVEIERVA